MTEYGIYRIKSGDNPWKIAKKAIIAEGKKPTSEAITQKMKELALQNNCESVDDFNKKFFSSVGLSISTVSAKPKPQGKTSEPSEPLETAEPVETSQPLERKMPSQMNSIAKLKQNISDAGGEPVEIALNKLPQKQRVKIESYLNLYNGATPTIIKDKKTGDVYAYLNTLNTSRGNTIKLQSMNIKINNAETVVTRYHRTGKIAQDIENNYDHSKDRSVLIQGPYKKQGAKKVITRPLNIDIKVNSDIYKNATPEQKQAINKFLGALESQKEQLMADLGIDNDTYNRFAKLAVAIAMQETKLGTATSYEDWEKTAIVGAAKDSVALINSGLKSIGINNPVRKISATSVSKGMTQIKIGDWIKSPAIKKLFNKYGITSGYYTQPTEEQSAAATIIVLNELSKRIKRPEYRDGITAANKKYYAVSKERKPEGGIETHDVRKWKLNKVTEDDAILYLYNGRAGVLKKGNATPTDNEYIANIRKNAKCVRVLENNHERAQALKEAKEYIPEDTNPSSPTRNMPRMQDDLGWGIGQVAFMPKVYSSGVKNNTEEEIEMIKSSLKAKGFSVNDINNLAGKMQNGEIAFVKGITSQELSAMTENDLKLLIQHCDRLNSKLSTIKTDATKRKYASDADKDFKRAYLSSHAVQTSLSDVKKASVKLNKASDKDIIKYPAKGYYTGAQKRCEGLLPQLRGKRVPDAGLALSSSRIKEGQYMGYKIEKDNGINQANASNIDILLAKNAADSANTLRTSGACLTGAKQALIGAGVVTPSEMRTFNKAFELAKFLREHPERFTEITHIQISPTMAREITAGDISSLPAGCIVVFGNKDRADVYGHSGITSGNGQIYADETDNSNWDNFTSEDSKQDGKGEHGYIRVFKLNPAYFAVDESGKKFVKK